MTLKQQVQIALIKKKWSQRELARQMGISMAYLQDILVENRTPIKRLKQIEELLDIDLGVDNDEPICN
ncbi:helix-turn-helix transcriptional regulator [Enterococcus hirae]|nr:helix-turn-helix transcriptional regulator [Enterococcus hirae]